MKGSRKKDQPQSALRRTLRNIAVVVGVFLLYAYGVQVTQIDLRAPLNPHRQDTLLIRLREFGRPALLTYETETQSFNLSLRSPCPEEPLGGQISGQGRTVTLSPNCSTTTQDVLTVTGEGFPHNARGIIRWHPPGDTAATRQTGSFHAGPDGRFSVNFTMPDVRIAEEGESQRIEVEELLGQDVAGLSNASQVTITRIIETILMALMASTLGTIIAVPVSFIAARNLMARSGATLAGLMTALAFLPIGGWLGWQLGRTLTSSAAQLSAQPVVGVAGLLTAVALFWFVGRLYVATQIIDAESKSHSAASIWQPVSLAALALLALALFGQLGLPFGQWLRDLLGWFGFFGGLIVTLADIARIMLPGILAFIGALIAISLGSRYGEEVNFNVTGTTARVITGVITAVGVGFTIYVFGLFLNWLYQFENLANWTTYPALILGGAAGLLAMLVEPRREMPAGLIIYYLMRGTLNTLRSIEPLVLGFVFVVWVGIGPFAGMLALMVHSIADLGKLFSEQVENIAEGPLEAVTATGANRVQTIVFAVIPQIIPPFIAFSFYRWDINVRMSTLIGFVGGGGIGLVLQQNINLTLYRQASVMIIAIAITVAILDYVSSELRNRLI